MKHLLNDSAVKQRRRELRKGQTDAEMAFWTQVRNRRFLGLKFFRQYSVGHYILDFYCPSIRVAVELDGGQQITLREENTIPPVQNFCLLKASRFCGSGTMTFCRTCKVFLPDLKRE